MVLDVYKRQVNEYEIDDSAVHMTRDNSKCILCRRCTAVCEKVQGIGVIGANERGFSTYIGSAFDTVSYTHLVILFRLGPLTWHPVRIR